MHDVGKQNKHASYFFFHITIFGHHELLSSFLKVSPLFFHTKQVLIANAMIRLDLQTYFPRINAEARRFGGIEMRLRLIQIGGLTWLEILFFPKLK